MCPDKPIPDYADDELPLNTLSIKKAALVLRAINHTLRQKLLKTIHQKKRVPVTELYKTLRLEQSVTSTHLATLRKAGFVHVEREGRNIFYSLNYKRLHDIQAFVHRLIQTGCLVLPVAA